METSEAAARLANDLRHDRLVALVGSAASAPYVDEGGRGYRGLPQPQTFVADLTRLPGFTFLGSDTPFVTACDEIVIRDGQHRLEELLVKIYDQPDAFPLPPAQKMLAWLPFRAYITSNYDRLLERSVESSGRVPAVVVENTDLIGIARGAIPVIKYHGCVSRPRTLVATSAQLASTHEDRRLLRHLLAVNVAQGSLLVIGHGLGDSDLDALLKELLEDLGQYSPTVYIVRQENDPPVDLQAPFRYEVVKEDLTQFLSRLLHEYRAGDEASGEKPRVFEEAWIKSAFFAQLRQASVLPSETQVIDAFLAHLADELLARNQVQSVAKDATQAVENALLERPNYEALRRIWSDLTDELTAAGEDLQLADELIHDLIDRRQVTVQVFKQAGRKIIQRDDRLLLYSQSQRVLQVLLGASTAVQRTCDVFVAECRPKSPMPYDDAASICRGLANSGYKIAVCPDVVAVNLIANRQITKVLMGTHAVYVDESNTPYAFVNTCGSLAIVLAARNYGVPVVVLGESLKIESVPKEEAVDHVYSHQENDLLSSATGLSDLATERAQVQHVNIGYDLVYVENNVEILIPDR